MNREEKAQYLLDKGWTVDNDGRTFNTRGIECRNLDKDGYIQITTTKGSPQDRLKILGHQLVFYKFNGFIPDMIDHIDRNRSNNNPLNLRPTTSQENRINSIQYDNAKCYTWKKNKKCFVVYKSIGSKYYHITTTKDENLAKQLGQKLKPFTTEQQILELKKDLKNKNQ